MSEEKKTTTQEQRRTFMYDNIVHIFSLPMDAILAAGVEGVTDMPTWDEMENLYHYECDECGEEYEDEEDAEKCCDSSATYIMKEVLEWYIVSPYLYSKLEEKGEVVINWMGLPIWGRQTSGQSTYMDHVIEEICNEELLPKEDK